MNWWWLTSNAMTVTVATGPGDRLHTVPPILHRFRGQSLASLMDWMQQQGGFEYAQLVEEALPGEPLKPI